jgi:protochlorophyllide reductase
VKALCGFQGWHVIIAARSFSKAEIAAKTEGLPAGSYTVMPLDLASLNSVRQFVDQIDTQPREINALVCNAAVWYPRDTAPRFTAEGFEEHVGTNHLGHFLLAGLMVPKLKAAEGFDPRIVFLGTDTHNPDSIAGKIPPQADLGELSGLTGTGEMRRDSPYIIWLINLQTVLVRRASRCQEHDRQQGLRSNQSVQGQQGRPACLLGRGPCN